MNLSFFVEQEKLLETSEYRLSKNKLSDCISDNFIEIGSDGKTYGKWEVIDAIINEASSGLSYSTSDFRVSMLSEDIVLVLYRVSAIYKGNNIESQRSSFWKNEDGVWRNIFHQVSRVLN